MKLVFASFSTLYCQTVENEEEEDENDMESEDRDGEGAEKPTVITFDPSLPTSHAVSVTAGITAGTYPLLFRLFWLPGC